MNQLPWKCLCEKDFPKGHKSLGEGDILPRRSDPQSFFVKFFSSVGMKMTKIPETGVLRTNDKALISQFSPKLKSQTLRGTVQSGMQY